MKKFALVLVGAVAGVSVSGCVGLKGNNLPRVDLRSAQIDLPQRKLVYLDFKAARGENSSQARYDAIEHKEVFREVILNSRCCELAGSKEQADYVFEGAVKRITSPYTAAVQLFTGGTLYLIPTWRTNTYEVDMSVRAPGGRTVRFSKSDNVTHYSWLPLLPVGILPPVLINTNTADAVTFSNLYNNVMLEIKKSGVLN